MLSSSTNAVMVLNELIFFFFLIVFSLQQATVIQHLQHKRDFLDGVLLQQTGLYMVVCTVTVGNGGKLVHLAMNVEDISAGLLKITKWGSDCLPGSESFGKKPERQEGAGCAGASAAAALCSWC